MEVKEKMNSTELKDLRIEKGATLEEIADYVGISKQRYHQIESAGITNTHESAARDIAEFFGKNLFELAGMENLKFKPQSKEDFDALIAVLEKAKAEL